MITLSGVSKSFRTNSGRKYVLKDVSLTIPDGKSVAILGRNGAGKSTLLRILGGIEHPDSGKVTCDGSVSWPVGLQGGMQGSLSGKENAKFVCRIYGNSEESVLEKVRFIEEFADIGDYFDMPVKTYSSGMKSRLGFAMSMAFDFDYFLIDEVTAVGDKDFREKCARALEERRRTSGVLMVSHDMATLRRMCDVGIHVSEGEARIYDTVEEAVGVYSRN